MGSPVGDPLPQEPARGGGQAHFRRLRQHDAYAQREGGGAAGRRRGGEGIQPRSPLCQPPVLQLPRPPEDHLCGRRCGLYRRCQYRRRVRQPHRALRLLEGLRRAAGGRGRLGPDPGVFTDVGAHGRRGAARVRLLPPAAPSRGAGLLPDGGGRPRRQPQQRGGGSVFAAHQPGAAHGLYHHALSGH